MSNICRFTSTASRDIESIIDYMADGRGFDVAERFLDKINPRCRNLANFPNMRRSRDGILPSLRSFPIDSYLILYRLIEDGIEVVWVVSGYRDLDTLFDEQD